MKPWAGARSASPKWTAPSSASSAHATGGPSIPRAQGVRRPLGNLKPRCQASATLLSTTPRCCKRVPPEAIVGYITVGRGVSIHAQSCANLRRLSIKSPARVLALTWGKTGSSEFPVEIDVQAFDRRGLVRDVSAALADDKISIRGMNTVTDKRDNVAHMRVEISITGLPQLSQVLARIAQLP